MGFSIIGVSLALIICAPNLLMIKLPPSGKPAAIRDAGKTYAILERIGQVGCLASLIISKDNFDNKPIDIWLILSALCILIYYALWIRYLVAGRDYASLYRFRAVPIPMAIVPILAFAFIAIWGESIWLGIAAGAFSIGHIANSWRAYASIRNGERDDG